ncbi:MAG TPA: hypothetical protein VK091_04560 [Virgibacillus sp.]|nr:hypothetical protein [Virgibacillus sp.]
MSLKEKEKVISEKRQKKMSPRERSVLRRYGIINKADNKERARTINELYEQRYRNKNH